MTAQQHVDDVVRRLRLPRHPALRPGWHVVRRDRSTLQVGIDRPALAPDTPQVRRLLAGLRSGRVPDDLGAEALGVLVDLARRDLVTDGDLPATDRAHFGSAAGRRRDRRTAATVGLRAAPWAADRVMPLLAAAGVAVTTGGRPPTAWLLLHEGEPDRSLLDPWVREGAPHLVVRSVEGRLHVGPFVVPGRTACLRCVDASLAEADHRRHLVVEQVARAAEGREPRDEVLWAMAAAWAVRDLARYAEGERPSTWSTSFVVGADGAPERREWRRHPHCGCAWDALPPAW